MVPHVEWVRYVGYVRARPALWVSGEDIKEARRATSKRQCTSQVMNRSGGFVAAACDCRRSSVGCVFLFVGLLMANEGVLLAGPSTVQF